MSLPKTVILEMSPLAFGLESELANTGITRVCRELILALDSVLLNDSDQDLIVYVYSCCSRWHNQLLAYCALTILNLKRIRPLIDPCEIPVLNLINEHATISLKGLRELAEPLISSLSDFGQSSCIEFLSTEAYTYLTSYLPTPEYIRKNQNVSVMHHIHDLFPLTKPSLFHGGIDDLWRKKIGDFMPQDRYVCISHSTASDLKKVFPFLKNDRVVVIPNAGDHVLRFSCNDAEPARSVHEVPAEPYFVTVSTLEPRKNLSLLLKAFTIFKQQYKTEHKLICVGAKGWMSEAEQEFLEQYTSSGAVQFAGRLSDEEVFPLVAGATAYISAAKCEGFGLGLAEAMALGCLPIAARNTSQIEVVEGIGLLFDGVDDLVMCMYNASNYSGTKEAIAEMSLRRYSWLSSARDFVRLFIES